MAQYKRSTQRKFRKNTQKKKINKRKTKGRKPIRRKSINRKKIGSGVHSDVSDDVTKNLLNQYSRAMSYYVRDNMLMSYGILKKMAENKCTYKQKMEYSEQIKKAKGSNNPVPNYECKYSCNSLPQDNRSDCEKNKAKIYYLAFTLLTKVEASSANLSLKGLTGTKGKLQNKFNNKSMFFKVSENRSIDEKQAAEEGLTVEYDILDYKDAYDAITNDPHYYLLEEKKDEHIGLERLILDVFESDHQDFLDNIKEENRNNRKSRRHGTLDKFVVTENKGDRNKDSYLNKRKMMYNNLKTVYIDTHHWFILGDEEQSKILKDRNDMVNDIDLYNKKKEQERKKKEEKNRLNTEEKLEERLDNFSELPFDEGISKISK